MKQLLIAFVAVATAACGDDGVSIDDFPNAYIDALCAEQVRCQSQTSAAQCEATTTLDSGSFATLKAAVARGTVKYDGELASACLDIIRDADCVFDGIYADSGCEDYFTGTVAQGGACVIAVECANDAPCVQTDASCDSDVACCPGTCGAPTVLLASGASCGQNDTCADGLYCKPPASGTGNGVCSALIAMEGGACDDLFSCADPMICNVFADPSVCQKPAPPGGTCNPDALIACADAREHCDDVMMKCVPALANGSPCQSGGDCLNSSSCASGTCQANSGVGGPCSDTGVDCLGSLQCSSDTSGTCQQSPPGPTCP